jgi:hypothetical protein
MTSIAVSQVVKVPVDSLEIDLPLDSANVTEKKLSMESSGLIQPLTLWQGPTGLRVIDGFHRIAAARLLGWQEIDAIVKSVSEEAFWDARIQSARQHASISNERLAVWVTSCWQASEWPGKLDLSKWRPGTDDATFSVRFRKRETHSLTPAHKQVAEALWLLRTDQVQPGDKERLAAWFQDKATKWAMTLDELEKIIYGLVALPQPNVPFEQAVVSKGLSFDKRNDLARQSLGGSASPVHFGNNVYSSRTAAEYLENALPGETFNQYAGRLFEESMKKRRVESAKTADQQINGHVAAIKAVVEQRFQDIRQMGPAGAAVLLNASGVILDLAEKVHPGAKRGDLSAVIASENIRLAQELAVVRSELSAAQRKIDKLESELRRRRSVLGSASSAAAVYHSAEIEGQ